MSQLFPACQIIPQPDFQFSFRVKGKERLRWHHDPKYSRPFFYPFTGPAGVPLTRIGHPGAPNHDHHRSIWFAHHQVLGINFWAENTGAQIIQKRWLSIDEREDEAILAVELEWFDGHDPQPLLRQESISAIRTNEKDELFLELQSTFYPTAESIEFQKTNFGFLAVRMAKSISSFFGAGNHHKQQTTGRREKHFWQIGGVGWIIRGLSPPTSQKALPTFTIRPILWQDHRMLFHGTCVKMVGWGRHPACMARLRRPRKAPLTFRFLLQAHAGEIDPDQANKIFKEFAQSRPYQLKKPQQRHTSASVTRAT